MSSRRRQQRACAPARRAHLPGGPACSPPASAPKRQRGARPPGSSQQASTSSTSSTTTTLRWTSCAPSRTPSTRMTSPALRAAQLPSRLTTRTTPRLRSHGSHATSCAPQVRWAQDCHHAWPCPFHSHAIACRWSCPSRARARHTACKPLQIARLPESEVTDRRSQRGWGSMGAVVQLACALQQPPTSAVASQPHPLRIPPCLPRACDAQRHSSDPGLHSLPHLLHLLPWALPWARGTVTWWLACSWV